MQRWRSTGSPPAPRPRPSWLAGVLIGGTIATIAASAMALGAGAAIQTVLTGPRRPAA